jgi:iron complex outermembrane receptor protein
MFKKSLRAQVLGCTSLLALLSPAIAQEAADVTPAEDDAVMETVVVKGYRESLENSINIRRNESSFVEAVTAEDIGKLPDVSIAESLGRLPGVATQRVEGRGSVLTIRGLGPDFSTALLNGREQVSISDNRGVEFDQYPSELLQSAVVYKTPYAGLIGQGLSGTVDMRTIRPLDLDDRVLSANVRYEWNEIGALNPDTDDAGWRASGIYVDQFANDTVGIAIGLAYQGTPYQNEKFNAWGYPDVGGDLIIGGAKPYVQTNELERTGVVGILEYEPSSTFSAAIDVYYSDFEEIQTLRGIEFPLQWSSAQLQPGYTVDNGFVTAGTFNNVHGVIRNDLNVRTAELFAAGFNVQKTLGLWTLEGDLSYSSADRKDDLIESYSGSAYATGGPGDSLGFQTTPGGLTRFTPSIDYADTNAIVLTDPQGWGAGNNLVQAGFINSPQSDDQLTQLRTSAKRELNNNWFSAAEVGVAYSMREKNREIGQQFLTLPNGATTAPIPAAALVGGTTGLEFLGVPAQVTYDPQYLLNNGFYTPVSVGLSSFSVPQSYQIEEDVTTVYGRLEIDSEFNGVPVSGNVGAQIVSTDQQSSGFRVGQVSNGAGSTTIQFIPVSEGDTYTNVLPSANLTFHLTDETQLRVGAARTLARARMDKLNASLSLGTNITLLTSTDPNQSFFSASGGNPQLRPYIADSLDIALEHYYSSAGYIAVSLFYKDLQDYVNDNDAFIADFSDYVSTELTPAQAALLGTTQGLVSGPTNRGEGHMQGVEFALAVPIGDFFEPLQGFGFQTAASYTESEVLLGSSTTPITVPGLSDWVVNSTVYYERGGFEARISHRYRSEFLAEVSGISATRVLRTAESESIIDAQIGYRFDGGRLDGLNVFLQGTNLTDEPFLTFNNGDERQVIDYQNYGATYAIGASYKF